MARMEEDAVFSNLRDKLFSHARSKISADPQTSKRGRSASAKRPPSTHVRTVSSWNPTSISRLLFPAVAHAVVPRRGCAGLVPSSASGLLGPPP
jgi:hypothetical protein